MRKSQLRVDQVPLLRRTDGRCPEGHLPLGQVRPEVLGAETEAAAAGHASKSEMQAGNPAQILVQWILAHILVQRLLRLVRALPAADSGPFPFVAPRSIRSGCLPARLSNPERERNKAVQRRLRIALSVGSMGQVSNACSFYTTGKGNCRTSSEPHCIMLQTGKGAYCTKRTVGPVHAARHPMMGLGRPEAPFPKPTPHYNNVIPPQAVREELNHHGEDPRGTRTRRTRSQNPRNSCNYRNPNLVAGGDRLPPWQTWHHDRESRSGMDKVRENVSLSCCTIQFPVGCSVTLEWRILRRP